MPTPHVNSFLPRRCPGAAASVLFSGFATPPRVLVTGAQGFLGVRLGAFLTRAGYAVQNACTQRGDIPAQADATAHAGGSVHTDSMEHSNSIAYGSLTPATPVRPTAQPQPAAPPLALCARATLDITSPDSIQRAIAHFAPELIFHCAAVSDTGQAQREPALSHAVNVQGTLHLAAACRAAGTKLVVMSSDQVYNGTHQSGNPPLSETAPLTPETVYGRHKLEAEQRTLALLPSAVFLRLTWMYDTLDTPFRQNSNVLVNLAAAARSNTTAAFATREWRGITDVWQVVQALPVAAGFVGGVYNFGSENALTSYATASATTALLGLPARTVQPDDARFAPTGRNLAMDTAKARTAGVAFSTTIAGLTTALGDGAL